MSTTITDIHVPGAGIRPALVRTRPASRMRVAGDRVPLSRLEYAARLHSVRLLEPSHRTR